MGSSHWESDYDREARRACDTSTQILADSPLMPEEQPQPAPSHVRRTQSGVHSDQIIGWRGCRFDCFRSSKEFYQL